MISFKDFINETKVGTVPDEPVPHGVRSEDWANLDWRRYWKMQNSSAPNLAQTAAPSPAQQQKPMGIGSGVQHKLPNRYDNTVANSLSLAMSPAGRSVYKYYWNDKEGRVKPNPYHPDNRIR